jgi:hypothetical protein
VSDIQLLRDLAHAGTLAAYAARATGPEYAALTGSAYRVAWPVVFSRLTRRLELRRGHPACAASVRCLADDCLDRFHDDVEAVVHHVLTRARHPIRDLEGWIASRITVATVEAHRRRRGERDALQRPRLPSRLAAALGRDPWLTTLATEILNWVGIPATAGFGTWPVDSWVERRARVTGDWPGSDARTVNREIDMVLAAMRAHPAWYARYVEGPLGRKQPPVAPGAVAAVGGDVELPPLPLAGRHEADDARLAALASAALGAIRVRLARGEPTARVVVEVVEEVFASDTGGDDLGVPPHASTGDDERALRLLADPAVVDRIVTAVMEIVRGEEP